MNGWPAVGIGRVFFAVLHQVFEHGGSGAFDGLDVFEEALALVFEDLRGELGGWLGSGGGDGGIEGVQHGEAVVFVERGEGKFVDKYLGRDGCG